MENRQNGRFLQRKEDWGYLLQDEWNDRLWAVDHETFGQMKTEDGSLPVWLENPYQYQGKFELGAIPPEKTLRAPISISWSITASCNSHCRFCCTDSLNTSVRQQEAGTEQIARILDDLVRWQVMRIIIGGGEPLIRPDISEILDLFQEKRFRPVLATNGLLLEHRLLDKAAEACINIQISLDTLNAERYRRLRGTDGLARVRKNIRAAAETGRLVRIVTVLTSENIDELPAIADELGAAGIRQWFIFEMLPSGRGQLCYDELHVQDMKKVKSCIHMAKIKYPGLSIWYWGNKKADGCSVYVLPDGSLNLTDYHTNRSKAFGMDGFRFENVLAFWDQIPQTERQKMLDNFLASNRLEEEV